MISGKEHFPDKAIIIASHPRSGTHLLIDFLRKQFSECQSHLVFFETRHHAYLTLDHLSTQHKPNISQKQALSILSKSKVPIIKTHCLPDFEYLGCENAEFIERLKSVATTFYVVRDGRDVMCSTYLWRQKFDPKAHCSLSDFLRVKYEGLTYPEIWAEHVNNWVPQPEVSILKYEDIIENPLGELKKISHKIDLLPLYKKPLLPKKQAPRSRWGDYFLRITRQFESTAIGGQSPKKRKNWNEILSSEDQNFFLEKAGKALIQLGYM